jgi:uncharacterized protein YegP (UPF0339 family)
MKNIKDKYNFTQLSNTKKAGFDSFQDTKSKLYYFHFNDGGKSPLLFSQGYQSAKGRDKGIISLKNCLSNADNIIRTKLNEHHYFYVKAANNQEVARSRNFTSFNDIEHAIEELLANLFTKTNAKQRGILSRQKAKPEANQSTLSTSAKPLGKKNEATENALIEKITTDHLISHSDPMIFSAKELMTSKSAFRIDFYQGEDQEYYNGRIVHLLSRDRKTFTGLDISAIIGFIEKFLQPALKGSKNKTAGISSAMPTHNQTPVVHSLQQHLAMHDSLMAQMKANNQAKALSVNELQMPTSINTSDKVVNTFEQPTPAQPTSVARMVANTKIKSAGAPSPRQPQTEPISQEEHLAVYGIAPLSPVSSQVENSQTSKQQSDPSRMRLSALPDNNKHLALQMTVNAKIAHKKPTVLPVMTQEEHLAFHGQLGCDKRNN